MAYQYGQWSDSIEFTYDSAWTDVPAQVQGVQAVQVGINQVHVTWQASNHATAYEVQKTDVPNGLVGTEVTTDLEFLENSGQMFGYAGGFVNGRLYQYRVRGRSGTA